MAWLGNTILSLAVAVSLIPDRLSYIAPPPLTIEQKILQELPPVFIEIAKAESTGGDWINPEAYNPEWHKGCQGSYGVFQLACLHFEGEPTYDIDTQIAIAKHLYETEGFRPWAVCTKKIVKCYE